MPRALTPPALRRALAKEAPAPAYFVAGTEALLRDEAVAAIVDRALDPALRDFNLDLLSAQQLDPGALGAACATLPMMAERRVVVVRDVEAWKRKTKAKQGAVDYLARPAPETVLILVQGGDGDLDKELAVHAVLVDCAPLTGDALDEWLDARLAAAEIALADDAREHLLRATGGDLGLLASEVAKLSGLPAGRTIDRDTVADLVGIRYGETPDDWRDAVLRDDPARAIALVPRLLATSGNSGVRLVALLGSSLILLRWARATADADRVRGRALGERVKTLLFEARPAIGSYSAIGALIGEVVGAWPLPRLRAAIAATLAADIALKGTTVSDETGIVTDLVLSLLSSSTQRAA